MKSATRTGNKKHSGAECFTPSRKQAQIDRTRSWIEEALLQISEHGGYSDATVSSICEKAGVGRPTFYRHFKTKEDVIRSRHRKIFNQFLSVLEDIGFDAVTTEHVNLATLENWREFAGFFKLVRFDDIRQVIFSESELEMQQLTNLAPIYAAMDPFVRVFRYWGMKGILVEWVAQDMRQSPEEIHRALKRITVG